MGVNLNLQNLKPETELCPCHRKHLVIIIDLKPKKIDDSTLEFEK